MNKQPIPINWTYKVDHRDDEQSWTAEIEGRTAAVSRVDYGHGTPSAKAVISAVVKDDYGRVLNYRIDEYRLEAGDRAVGAERRRINAILRRYIAKPADEKLEERRRLERNGYSEPSTQVKPCPMAAALIASGKPFKV